MLSRARPILCAIVLVAATGGAARGEGARPAAAGSGEVVARVHLRVGQGARFRAAGKEFPAVTGTPLLRSDVLYVPPGEVLVVLLGNGHLVRLDEDLTLKVGDIVLLGAPPPTDGVAARLDRLVSREEQGRAERIAGTLARRAGAEAVAPQGKRAEARPKPKPTLRGGTRGGGGGLGGLAGIGGGGDVGAGAGAGAVAERVVRAEVTPGAVEQEGGDGTVALDGVRLRLRQSMGAVRACYERALRANPTLAGRLTVRFTLAPSGRVTAVVTDGLEGGSEVAACVTARFRTLLFPAPAGGAVELVVPLELRPSP